MLHKSRRPIADLEDWRLRAKPKSVGQWKDFRSAKEVAKHWLAARPSLPADIIATLASHPDFSTVSEWSAEPEARLPFDARRGEPRNADLLVLASDVHGPFVVAVEAKADETFGPSIATALADARKRLEKNPRSGGVARIEDLIASLVPGASAGSAEVAELRYQLLTAAAGVLAYATEHRMGRAVLFVEEFITVATKDERHAANAADLNRWLHQISGGAYSRVGDRKLVGPITVPGGPLVPAAPALYVGKSQVQQRGGNHGAPSATAVRDS
jgi:hypothetical protein